MHEVNQACEECKEVELESKLSYLQVNITSYKKEFNGVEHEIIFTANTGSHNAHNYAFLTLWLALNMNHLILKSEEASLNRYLFKEAAQTANEYIIIMKMERIT